MFTKYVFIFIIFTLITQVWWCTSKLAFLGVGGGEALIYVAFANFHGVNTPTMIYFLLAMV